MTQMSLVADEHGIAPETASGYRCIAADPPWPERGGGKSKRGADRHYPLLSTEDIPRVMMQSQIWLPADDAHLWLWVTDNYLTQGLALVTALGFRYVRTAVWVKPTIGLGQYLRGQHELCLFAVRGRLPACSKAVPSVFGGGPLPHPCYPNTRRRMHSAKPPEAYGAIERVSPGPRLEMFARRPRPGWDVWGNEVSA